MESQFEFLILSFIAYIIGTCSPGPNILSILETSMSIGRRSALALALGIVTGSMFWGILSVFGITLLLLQFPSALLVLQICGALYLIYLAYKSFRAAFYSNLETTIANTRKTLIQRYLRGLLIQITNPKSAITWLTVYSIALTKTASLHIALSVVLGNLVLSFLIHTGYATFFSGTTVRNFLLRKQKTIQLAISCFFFILAMLLLFAKIGVS